MFTETDERAHRPPTGAGPHWEESWHFDFVSADARTAGYARLTLRPADATAWWWAVVVGADLPLVMVRDHDVTPPKPGTFEIRGSGLWAEPVCETPFVHWSLGLEAFAVGLDDPIEAYGGERGEPLPLGLDLEWEATGEPVPGADGYGQDCSVHGDVLVGHQRLVVAGHGALAHRWGDRDWWSAAGVDGESATGGHGLDDRGLLVPDGGLLPVYHAPIQVPHPTDGSRVSRLARALCHREADGTHLWAERLQPAWSTIG